MYDVPAYVWGLLLVAVLGIPALTAAALYRGSFAAGLGRRKATGLTAAFAAGWAGWLLLTGYLAGAGVYTGRFSWFLVAVAGALTGLLAATRVPVIARILADLGVAAPLVLPHTLRILGVVFLVLMAQGHLPAVFAVPAGLGDIAVGVAAFVVARRLARGEGHGMATRFHLLGIADLILAAGIAAAITFGPLDVVPSTDVLRLLPLALVPTAAVPLAVALHVVSLRRLRAIRRAIAPTAEPAMRVAGGRGHRDVRTP